MDTTTQASSSSEWSFSSLMMKWGASGWGSKKDSGRCLEDREEDEKNYQNCDYWTEEMQTGNQQSSSSSFSFSSSAQLGSELSRKEQKSAAIAACFLKDYEGGQPPTLSNNFSDISRRQLLLYRVKHSFQWNLFGLSMATIFLFVASFSGPLLTIILHTYSIIVFAIDLYMKDQFSDEKHKMEMSRTSKLLFHSMRSFLFLMCLQNILEFFFLNNSIVHSFTLAASVFKPIVFFYQSRRARDALEALIRISKKLLRVILIELFLILVFATIACRLYYEDESFQSLPQSWLSLFALSTTVVNPSIWMPAYNESPWNAVFFVIFIVVSIFYLHSLVLSVVFQVFIQSAKEVHRRSNSDKDNSLKLAFLALAWARNNPKKNRNEFSTNINDSVDINLICETLRLLRPHYSQQKLNVLIDIIAPSRIKSGLNELKRDKTIEYDNKRNVNFDDFRMRIQQALSSSIRATRTHSTSGMAVEIFSISVSILNFLYVIVFASRLHPGDENDISEFIIGSFITLLSLFEASLRYKILQRSNGINPITRLNTILDGMGCFGGIVSFIGTTLYLSGHESGMEYLLIGRSIGMIQSMRFSIWFREVLQRSLYVLPFLAGPVFLILTAMHVFVYIGMALWEGTVDVEEQGSNENVEYLYYLNNFNSYREGCITVFNVLVVNDWHQIANVFLYASRFSSPIIVYIYFVMLVIIAVCILLNVIVAFFVETFVTQLNLVDVENETPNINLFRNVSTSTLQSEVSTRIAPIAHSWIFDANDLKKKNVRSSSCPRTGEVTEFDVILREGFDDIMESVANDDDNQFEVFARSLLDALELVSTLTFDRHSNIGHMLCSRQNKSQFQSRKFSAVVKDYLPRDEDIQSIIAEIEDKLSNTNSSDLSSNTYNRAGMFIPNPNDNSRVLQVDGAILPQNNTVLLLTVVINELQG